jgi:hypothetical protein
MGQQCRVAVSSGDALACSKKRRRSEAPIRFGSCSGGFRPMITLVSIMPFSDRRRARTACMNVRWPEMRTQYLLLTGWKWRIASV